MDKYVYLIGGNTANDSTGNNTCETYNLNMNKWKNIGKIIHCNRVTAYSFNGFIYFSGYNLDYLYCIDKLEIMKQSLKLTPNEHKVVEESWIACNSEYFI